MQIINKDQLKQVFQNSKGVAYSVVEVDGAVAVIKSGSELPSSITYGMNLKSVIDLLAEAVPSAQGRLTKTPEGAPVLEVAPC